ncbi:hypothetical protein [Fibrella aestuarina]|nr:hypothetical protein [Fibrella aestuarina]
MVTFLVVFGLFFLAIRGLLKYTSQTLGDESPLSQPVTYAYPNDYFWWRETVWVLPITLLVVYGDWLFLTRFPTATKLWHYLLIGFMPGLTAFFIYVLSRLYWTERQLATIIKDTLVYLDPPTQSMVVSRASTDTVLTTANVAAIEMHTVSFGKFLYLYFRFIDQDGCATPIYDYGKGLPFGIEAYFKGIPVTAFTHSYPTSPLPLS